jgi:hypothetical protein
MSRGSRKGLGTTEAQSSSPGARISEVPQRRRACGLPMTHRLQSSSRGNWGGVWRGKLLRAIGIHSRRTIAGLVRLHFAGGSCNELSQKAELRAELEEASDVVQDILAGFLPWGAEVTTAWWHVSRGTSGISWTSGAARQASPVRRARYPSSRPSCMEAGLWATGDGAGRSTPESHHAEPVVSSGRTPFKVVMEAQIRHMTDTGEGVVPDDSSASNGDHDACEDRYANSFRVLS